jgi:hypothetical protein
MSGVESRIRAALRKGETVCAAVVPVYLPGKNAPFVVFVFAKGSGDFSLSFPVMNPIGSN